MGANFENQAAYDSWCQGYIDRLHYAVLSNTDQQIGILLRELRRKMHVSEGDNLIGDDDD